MRMPLGQFFDRAAEYVRDTDPATLAKWRDANRVGLQEFWARAISDALELKNLIEAKLDAKAVRAA